jgi:YVTN family beta-propeller protein
VSPNSVVVIDPATDAVVDSIPVGSGPGPIAVGEGAVWLAHGEEVSRIDPVTNEVVATIPAGGTWTTGIEAGEGAVWVQEDGTSLVRQERSDSPDGIVRIDPRTDSVETKIPVEGVASIDVGQGSVWALSYTFGLLWRIDTRSNLAEQSISGIGQSPTVLTLGEPDVWVLDGFELRRIDPFSNQVVATIAVSRNVETIAAGEGALWGTVHR